MFTGIVRGLGTLHGAGAYRLEIACAPDSVGAIVPHLELGDSVAVDGVCLTVEAIRDRGFVASVSPETLSRTALGDRQASGEPANLELSLAAGSKLGGHFVTGHADGVGHIAAIVQSATSWDLTVSAPAAVGRYIVRKGSIAVNGISLTVADCSPDGQTFTAAVIPHTYAETNLSRLRPGSPVNLEGDILGKYVEKFLGLGRHYRPEAAETEGSGDRVPELSLAFLQDHGYA